jgi:GDPmannose 4,6-dehydratase
LNSFRDWGYCPDYADGIIKLLHYDNPDDFVLATNETHTIREFIEESVKVYNDWLKEKHRQRILEYNHLDYIDLEWQGTGENEIGYCKNREKAIIKINPKYYRPAEVDLLLGDPSKAKELLGWTPTTKFKELVEKMMIYDLNKKTN